jgi:O-antigen ligase
MKKEDNILATLFYVYYMLVHLMPPFWGADGMGIHWLYVSAMDLLVVVYLLLNRAKYKEGIAGIFKNRFIVVYLLYFIWAIGSYFYAINRIEALVCLSRLVSTFVLFISLSVFLYKKDLHIELKRFSLIITVLAILDFIVMVVVFFMFFGKIPYDRVILNLCGMSYGNKNITAASMLVNVPFIIYYINQSKKIGKVLGVISLMLAVFLLFILSTRSTFVGLFLISLIYLFYILFIQEKRSARSIFINLSIFILPLIFVYFTSNLAINYALKSNKGDAGYGTVTKRIAQISFEQSGRTEFWKAGIDYTKHHLLLGGGYGNWKITSLPYEKDYISDFTVRYHAHNDFIENFADLGVIGGSLFILLFLIAFLLLLKAWFSKKHKQYVFAITICFMAITCYFVDASLNFPAERPVMQVMFAFSAALLVAPISKIKNNKETEEGEKVNDSGKTSFFIKIFITVMTLLLLAAIFINTQVYRSMLYQARMMGDLGAVPSIKMKDVKNVPLIPNLSFNTLPMNAILARYYIRDSNYKEAYRLLNADKNANPSIGYNEYVMSKYFAAINNNDSAYFYAKQAYHKWPRTGIYFYNLMPLAITNKDTAEMNLAFKGYIKYSNDLSVWKMYILGRKNLTSLYDANSNNALIDSAIKLFPNDSSIIKLK